jgi:hypothetical protein
MSAEESKEGRFVDPSSTDTVRNLTGRVMSRRQVLAGGALAGVAALVSMPKVAGAAVDSSRDVPTKLTYYGQGTFGRLFPRLPAFAQDRGYRLSPKIALRYEAGCSSLVSAEGSWTRATRRLRRTR